MGEWNITIHNLTGEGGLPARSVQVMLFQSVPDKMIVDSRSTAWHIADIQYPGSLGPIKLPAEVKFFALDKTSGLSRATGPFDANFGQIIEVTQKKKENAPSVAVSGEKQPQGEIKVTNMGGNAQALEMALYKSGKKIVSFKDVNPGQAVYLAVKPVLYIADIEGKRIVTGDDFEAVVQAAQSTPIPLNAALPEVVIGIKQKPTRELFFEKIN